MTTLVDAIRTYASDGSVTTSDLTNLLRAADTDGEAGVDSGELQQVLRVVDSSEHGFTPELRAQLLVRLGDMGERSRASLQLAESRVPAFTGAERIVEQTAMVGFAIQAANGARRELDRFSRALKRKADAMAWAEGRLEPKQLPADADAAATEAAAEAWQKAVQNLEQGRAHATGAMRRLREQIEGMDPTEREIAFASLQGSDRRLFDGFGSVKSDHLIGATEEEVAQLQQPPPASPLVTPAEPRDAVAGMQFAEPTTWQFANGRFDFPEGTRITQLPAGGSFDIRGSGITLPNGTVLESGSLWFEDGDVEMQRGAVASVGGIPFRATNIGARVRGSGNTFAAGPNVTMELPEIAATDAGPMTQRPIRFTVNEAQLPGGTHVLRGTGNAVALVNEDDSVAGVLEGSVAMGPGAITYFHAERGTPLVDSMGERGSLERGAVVMRDGAIIGATANSVLTLDGTTLRIVGRNLDGYAPYKYRLADRRQELAPGTTVESLPEEGIHQIAGEDITFDITGQRGRLISGGVVLSDGRITDVLPNSALVLQHGMVRTGSEPVHLAQSAELEGRGDQVFLGHDKIVAHGTGFAISGADESDLLAGGSDPLYVGRKLKNEVRLNGGTVRVEPRAGMLNRPDGLRIGDVKGDVEVISGPLHWSSQQPSAAGPGEVGAGGSMMWIEHAGNTYELDPRAMYSTFDPATDSGRARKIEPVMSERFRAADPATGATIASGTAELHPGDEVSQAFMTGVQNTLAYYLRRPIATTGVFDADTETAVRDFQRFNALEPTGVIDADTFAMLDDIAPELDRSTVQVMVGGRFPDEARLLAESIVNGAAPIEYHRGGRTPKGPLVAEVQRVVHAYPADGIFGAGSQAKLMDWQTEREIPATGAIDAATIRAIADTKGTQLETMIEPRPKLMVMVAMNNDVEDEFRRFHELAAERGAQSVLIGPPDQPLQDSRELTRYLGMAESGAADLDWLVISGHSTGSSTWGKLGRFKYSDLKGWKDDFPRAFAQVEKLNLLNCYNVTPERARNFWPSVFPNLQGAAGFMYSAPGRKSQSSDEFLLHSGRILAGLGKGEPVSSYAARSMARRFERDDYIMWQNAAMFLRTQDNPDGIFGMTTTAKNEMEAHGAEDELRLIPERFTDAFDNYLAAETEQFAEPPHDHDSILRQYLGAVQHIVDTWQGRMQELERFETRRHEYLDQQRELYVAEHGDTEGYHSPNRRDFPEPLRTQAEAFRRTNGWEREYESVQELRARILNLIKANAIQQQFATFNAPTIAAFNDFMERGTAQLNAERTAAAQAEAARRVQAGEPPLEAVEGATLIDGVPVMLAEPVLLPDSSEWGELNRYQMLQRLDAVVAALNVLRTAEELDPPTNEVIEQPEWAIMVGQNPNELEYTSPHEFLLRLNKFVRNLEPEFIQAEWLDDTLLARDVQAQERARAALGAPA